MSRLYKEGHRELQRQFDTERLADRLEQVTYHTLITPEDREFIERRDMFFLATADAEGRPNCSYKGGDPGFVRVLDQSTIVFPELRRQRHVPVVRQRADEPARRPAVHRLRSGQAHARERHCVDRADQRGRACLRSRRSSS